MKMEQTECSKMSAYKIQTAGNRPKESIQHSVHGESLKSRNSHTIYAFLGLFHLIILLHPLHMFLEPKRNFTLKKQLWHLWWLYLSKLIMNIKTVLHTVAMERSAIVGGNDGTLGFPHSACYISSSPLCLIPSIPKSLSLANTHVNRMAKGTNRIHLCTIHGTTLSAAQNTHTQLNDRVITNNHATIQDGCRRKPLWPNFMNCPSTSMQKLREFMGNLSKERQVS